MKHLALYTGISFLIHSKLQLRYFLRTYKFKIPCFFLCAIHFKCLLFWYFIKFVRYNMVSKQNTQLAFIIKDLMDICHALILVHSQVTCLIHVQVVRNHMRSRRTYIVSAFQMKLFDPQPLSLGLLLWFCPKVPQWTECFFEGK